jgi:hypothetical protein
VGTSKAFDDPYLFGRADGVLLNAVCWAHGSGSLREDIVDEVAVVLRVGVNEAADGAVLGRDFRSFFTGR